jgi:hypothetical protein
MQGGAGTVAMPCCVGRGARVNPYKILQVDRDAEPEVIEAAYRRLVTKYHPDRNDSPEAGAMLRDLNAAYELVSDPERRAHYDREWANGRGTRRTTQPPHTDDEDETPTRVVLNVLVAGAVLTLLVYQPRLGATLVALSALIWLAWKYALITAVVGRSVLALLVLVVLGFAVRYWLEERRATTELRGLDLKTLFAAKLREQSRQCTATVTATQRARSAAACECLAAVIRAHFDFSPVNVDTAVDYRAVVSARFEHAQPSDEDRAACLARDVPAAR